MLRDHPETLSVAQTIKWGAEAVVVAAPVHLPMRRTAAMVLHLAALAVAVARASTVTTPVPAATAHAAKFA